MFNTINIISFTLIEPEFVNVEGAQESIPPAYVALRWYVQ